MQAENSRAVIGDNSPPIDAITLAQDPLDALKAFLKANPVISTEEESRDAKAVLDAATAALRRVEVERKGKVDPLRTQVNTINGFYHQVHNADAKRPGSADKLVNELLSRLSAYAREEERKRFEAEQAARRAAEIAEAAAKRAAEAEAEAREMAEAGVCDVDLAGAMEAADTTSQQALRAMWTARRAEGQTKVRITGGSRNAMSLQDHETLIVTDWKAAIEEMCDGDGNPHKDITDAIIKRARVYRKDCGHLPSGMTADYERSL